MKRIAMVLLLALVLVGGCGVTGNVNKKANETIQAGLNKTEEQPVGTVVTNTGDGTVTVSQGDEAIKPVATTTTNVGLTGLGKFDYSLKNPFTLLIMAVGLLALFLVISYIAKKTGADKATKRALAAIDGALQRANSPDEQLELERAKSALQ